VFVAGVTEQDLPHVLRLAHELRDGGVLVEYALSPQPLGKQLKLADARGARIAVVIGPDDRARGEVMMKDLQAKTQHAAPLTAVQAEIQSALSGGGEPQSREERRGHIHRESAWPKRKP
jgi:histidyl-tRNA synthetase